ncbi:hypothetical protein [Corynebacterium sp. A21]|uniref:hypothetical protein n=1 Tax=Corynebacterium sp. A21 TaxID=3457318 RepID=UPI003FD00192
MNKVSLRNFNMLGKEASVSVADVQRVRRQRRLAQTDQEHADVRAHMRDLSGGLRAKPRANTKLLKISGISVIVLGLIISGVLFYVADLVWPMWRALMES